MNNIIADRELDEVSLVLKSLIVQAHKVVGVCLASAVDEEENQIHHYRHDALTLGTRLMAASTGAANAFARLRQPPRGANPQSVDSGKRMDDAPDIHNI